MKQILFGCLAAILFVTARSASAPQQLPTTLQGNWSTADGSQTWVYGLHPTVAVWQNAFWDYTGVTTKGAVTTILTAGAGRRPHRDALCAVESER